MIDSKLPALGQNFRFGFYDISPKRRMRAIKEAGFDDVMIHWDEDCFVHQDGSPKELFEEACRLGLDVKTCHFPQQMTNSLWLEGLDGDEFLKELIRTLGLLSERKVKNLVVHVDKGTMYPRPSQIGLDRVKKAVEAAEKGEITVAFENVRSPEHLSFIYDNISSKSLGFCYDCGHAACFMPNCNPLEMFKEYLVTTHLSDNFGPGGGDKHLPLYQGSLDIKSIVKRLIELEAEALNLESYIVNAEKIRYMSLEEYLEYSYKGLYETVELCAHEVRQNKEGTK